MQLFVLFGEFELGKTLLIFVIKKYGLSHLFPLRPSFNKIIIFVIEHKRADHNALESE